MKQSETGKGSENVGGLEGEFFIPSKMPKNHIPQIWRIPQFKIKITEILQEKLSNTAIPQTPMSPSVKQVPAKSTMPEQSPGT